VACSSVTSCIAVGSYYDARKLQRPLVERFTNGRWTAVRPMLPAGYTTRGGYMYTAACQPGGECAAVGANTINGGSKPLVEILVNGNWSGHAVVVPSDTNLSGDRAFISDVTCLTAGYCLAAGQYPADDGSTQGLLVTSR
jgi:hypothetical protein